MQMDSFDACYRANCTKILPTKCLICVVAVAVIVVTEHYVKFQISCARAADTPIRSCRCRDDRELNRILDDKTSAFLSLPRSLSTFIPRNLDTCTQHAYVCKRHALHGSTVPHITHLCHFDCVSVNSLCVLSSSSSAFVLCRFMVNRISCSLFRFSFRFPNLAH